MSLSGCSKKRYHQAGKGGQDAAQALLVYQTPRGPASNAGGESPCREDQTKTEGTVVRFSM